MCSAMSVSHFSSFLMRSVTTPARQILGFTTRDKTRARDERRTEAHAGPHAARGTANAQRQRATHATRQRARHAARTSQGSGKGHKSQVSRKTRTHARVEVLGKVHLSCHIACHARQSRSLCVSVAVCISHSEQGALCMYSRALSKPQHPWSSLCRLTLITWYWSWACTPTASRPSAAPSRRRESVAPPVPPPPRPGAL